jgi:hypothetical protein
VLVSLMPLQPAPENLLVAPQSKQQIIIQAIRLNRIAPPRCADAGGGISRVVAVPAVGETMRLADFYADFVNAAISISV